MGVGQSHSVSMTPGLCSAPNRVVLPLPSTPDLPPPPGSCAPGGSSRSRSYPAGRAPQSLPRGRGGGAPPAGGRGGGRPLAGRMGPPGRIAEVKGPECPIPELTPRNH